MKGRPSLATLLRQASPSILIATLIAFLATRINPPLTIQPPPRRPLLTEIIPDIELDTRTFKRAIKSLAAKTHAKLKIDPSLAEALAKDQESAGGANADQISLLQHFKNVELGSLLARLLDQWGDRLPVHYRIERNTITFSPHAPAAKEKRILQRPQPHPGLAHLEKTRESWEPQNRPRLPAPAEFLVEVALVFSQAEPSIHSSSAMMNSPIASRCNSTRKSIPKISKSSESGPAASSLKQRPSYTRSLSISSSPWPSVSPPSTGGNP